MRKVMRWIEVLVILGLLFGAGVGVASAASETAAERPGDGIHPECRDRLDNDGDGVTDFPADPGCENADDDNEDDPAPPSQCSDGLDNGDPEDTVADYPADPGCESADDNDETDPVAPPECSDGIDNDGDGTFDFGGNHPDPDCDGPEDESEFPECSDGIDNGDAEDTVADFPADPGCESATDDDETDPVAPPECSDGIDNGDPEDTVADFPADPGCESADDDDETDAVVGGHRCDDPDGLAGAGGGGTIVEQLYHGVLEGTPGDGTLYTEPMANGTVSKPLYDGAKGTPLEDVVEEGACGVSLADGGAL